MSVAQNATPDDGSRYLCDLCNGNRFISLAGLTNHYYFFHHKTLSPEKVRRVFKKVPKQKSVYDPARRKKNKTIVDITDDSDHGSDDEFNNQNDEKRSNVPREPNRNENVQIVAVKKIAGQSVDNTDTPDVFNQPSRLLLELLQSNLIEKELHTKWLRTRRDCYMAMFDAECNLFSAYSSSKLEYAANDDKAELTNSGIKLESQIANFDEAFINLMNDNNKLRDDAAELFERICTSIDKSPIVKDGPETKAGESKTGSDSDVDK